MKSVKAEPEDSKATLPPVKADPEDSKAIYTTSIAKLECTQQWPNSSKTETVALVEGSENLLVAHFSNGTYQTELSNLLFAPALALASGVKKKPAGSVKKKPAAAAIPAEPAEPAAAAAIPADPPGKKHYQVLWYKNGHNVGIRQTFGAKTQIFGFGGKLCQKTEEELVAIGNIIQDDLQGGMSPEAAKRKAKDLAKAE